MRGRKGRFRQVVADPWTSKVADGYRGRHVDASLLPQVLLVYLVGWGDAVGRYQPVGNWRNNVGGCKRSIVVFEIKKRRWKDIS